MTDSYNRAPSAAPGSFSVDREALAWAAGFFDGEGCFFIVKPRGRNRLRPGVTISQVRPEPLDRFLAAVGSIGKVRGPYGAGPSRKQSFWKYDTSTGADAVAVMAMLWPFLSLPKREQAQRVFSVWAADKRAVYVRGGEKCRRGHSDWIKFPSYPARSCRVCHNQRVERARQARAERPSAVADCVRCGSPYMTRPYYYPWCSKGCEFEWRTKKMAAEQAMRGTLVVVDN